MEFVSLYTIIVSVMDGKDLHSLYTITIEGFELAVHE